MSEDDSGLASGTGVETHRASQRPSRSVTWAGETLTVVEWASRLGVTLDYLREVLRRRGEDAGMVYLTARVSAPPPRRGRGTILEMDAEDARFAAASVQSALRLFVEAERAATVAEREALRADALAQTALYCRTGRGSLRRNRVRLDGDE